MQFRTLLLALVALAIPSQAADQYWVSLGSFGELKGAEQVRDRASASFYELSIIPSEAPTGFVYRVVEGPMADRASADVRLSQARAAGFADAWLVIQESSVPLGGSSGYETSVGISDSYTLPPAEALATDDGYANRYRLENSVSGQVLEGYSSSDDATAIGAPSAADYNKVNIGNEELVETAPAGYGLHRLERSESNLPPGAGADSRLHELRSEVKDSEVKDSEAAVKQANQ